MEEEIKVERTYLNPSASFINLITLGMRFHYPSFEFYRSAFSEAYIMRCLKCTKEREYLYFKDFHADDKQFNQEMVDAVVENHKDCSKKK